MRKGTQMQRYSRNRDRDDERGRDERGSQARNEERFSHAAYRSDELGSRREPDHERGASHESSAYGSDPGSSRWREPGTEQDRFERPYGRSGAHYGGRDQNHRANLNDHGDRTAWQPAHEPMGDPRRSQYGETDYGVYGPRYDSGYPRNASHVGDASGHGRSQYQDGYGYERGDDRYGRQGYGQSDWHQEHEREQHRFDPDYLQWRAEQIRNLDNDYFCYRRDRYKQFVQEFDSWRRNRESSSGASGSATAQEASSQDITEATRDPLRTARNQNK